MLIGLEAMTMVVMFALTYVLFQSLGSPRRSLLYTRAEKDQWDSVVQKPLGSWLTLTSIVGTLTSFATVYLFFIGSTHLFGWWTILCCIGLYIGSYITLYFTRRVCETPSVKALLRSHDQTGGVIASLFWSEASTGRQLAATIKWISLINIGAIIWLDFSLFADISSRLLFVHDLIITVILVIASTFLIVNFTLRYGLRGFVFADLLQSPIVVFATLTLFAGCCVLAFIEPATFAGWHYSLRPTLSSWECVPFAFHVMFLNLGLVLTTEPHWLRIWLFGDKENHLQVRSVAATACVWLVLMLIGLVASWITGQSVPEQVTVDFLLRLYHLSPVFIIAFWVGGVAALFSSADSQVYSWLVVHQFDTLTGRLRPRLMASIQPVLTAGAASVAFGAIYWIVRYFRIPFDRLVFLIIPLSLNVLPAFVLTVRQAQPSVRWVWFSLGLYVVCATLGLRESPDHYTWTLAAALCPLLVSFLAAAKRRRAVTKI